MDIEVLEGEGGKEIMEIEDQAPLDFQTSPAITISRKTVSYLTDDPLAFAERPKWRDQKTITIRESKNCNAALQDYALMGMGRSLAKLLAQYEEAESNLAQAVPTLSSNTLSYWSDYFAWQERVARWTEIQDAEELVRWQGRRDEIRNADYAQGDAMRELATKVLEAGPQFVKTTRRVQKLPDGNEREIITMAIDIHGAAKLIEMGSKLQRLSAGMTNARKSIDITVEMMNKLPDEVLAQIQAGKLTAEQVLAIVQEQQTAGSLSSGERSELGESGASDPDAPGA